MMEKSTDIDRVVGKRFSVACYINGFQNFYHLSHVHAGLLQLRRSGIIDLAFTYSKPSGTPREDPAWTPWLEVTELSTHSKLRVVIDLDDRTHVYHRSALESCDVYFKRNLRDLDIEQLPEHLKVKLESFGLHYHCRARMQTTIILRKAFPHLLLLTTRQIKAEAKHLPKRARALREFARMLRIEDYEQAPDVPVEPVIFFQPRISTKVPNAQEWLIKPRVDLVRALKREFGSRFVGGLAPNDDSRRLYPDLVSPYSRHPVEYIAMGKRALIGIASQPCVDTSSMKLAEYLAASRCIVSPPVQNRFPRPLLDEIHYLGFRSVDQCVEQCDRLFSDRVLAQEMRRNNWKYYLGEVAPAQHMMNLLEKSFSRSVNDSDTSNADDTNGRSPSSSSGPRHRS